MAPLRSCVRRVITIPLAGEYEVLVLVAELVSHEKVWLIFLSNFVLGDLFWMALGVMEVTMAERLVRGAHGPGEALHTEEVELLDTGTSV